MSGYKIDNVEGIILNENGGSIGVGNGAPGAKLHITGNGNSASTHALLVENSDNYRMFEVDDAGITYIGLPEQSTIGTISGAKIVNKLGNSNGLFVIDGSPTDGTNNTTSHNQSISFTMRNSSGSAAEAFRMFLRYRNVTSGSEYAVLNIGNAIQTENSDGNSGTTVVASRNRITNGSGNFILTALNAEADTTGVFKIEQFTQNTGVSFEVRSSTVSTSSNTVNWRLLNNHKFTHNIGQLSTGDFNIMGDTDSNLFYADASTDRIGIGTSIPTQILDVAGNISVQGGYYMNTELFIHATKDGDIDDFASNNIFIGRNTPTGATGTVNDGLNNVAIGANALTSLTEGFYNIAIGTNALDAVSTGRSGIAIGINALTALNGASQSFSIGIGENALNSLTNGNYHYALGTNSGNNVTGGTYTLSLGYATGAESSGSYTNTIALGSFAKFNANNQVVLGANNAHFNEMWLGAGATDQTAINPTSFSFKLTNIAAGNTDVSSDYDLQFFSSAGTGTGQGGDIKFKVAPPGTTGTAQNSFIDAMVITDDGDIGIGTTVPDSSAIVEMNSTSQGFLPPVMTGAQVEAISSPATGLMAYATNAGSGDVTAAGWWGYNGTNWVQLG